MRFSSVAVWNMNYSWACLSSMYLFLSSSSFPFLEQFLHSRMLLKTQLKTLGVSLWISTALFLCSCLLSSTWLFELHLLASLDSMYLFCQLKVTAWFCLDSLPCTAAWKICLGSVLGQSRGSPCLFSLS